MSALVLYSAKRARACRRRRRTGTRLGSAVRSPPNWASSTPLGVLPVMEPLAVAPATYTASAFTRMYVPAALVMILFPLPRTLVAGASTSATVLESPMMPVKLASTTACMQRCQPSAFGGSAAREGDAHSATPGACC